MIACNRKFAIGKEYWISLPIHLGFLCSGLSMGWTSPTILKLQDPDQTPLQSTIGLEQASIIGSLMYIGCIIMPNIIWPVANKYGRKPCLLFGAVLHLAAWALIVGATDLTVLYAARTVNGFSMGIMVVGGLGYVGEIAKTKSRGPLLTATSLFQSVGNVSAYAIGPYVGYVAFGVYGLGMALLHGASLFFIPESPAFYLLQGRYDDVVKALHAIGRTPLEIKEEIEEMQKNLDSMKEIEKENTFKKLFATRANRHALFITTILATFPQLGGAIQVSLFSASIYEAAGSTIEPNLATIISGSVALATGCIAPFLVESLGRKILLYISSSFNALSLLVLGLYFYLSDIGYNLEHVGWLPLATLIVFWLSYGLGLDTIPFTLIGELFHVSVKGLGASIAITTAWTCGFIVTSVFGLAVTTVGAHVIFWTFAAVKVLTLLHTWLFVPETKGRTPAQIQHLLNTKTIMIHE